MNTFMRDGFAKGSGFLHGEQSVDNLNYLFVELTIDGGRTSLREHVRGFGLFITIK
jgi:hypothetical protein